MRESSPHPSIRHTPAPVVAAVLLLSALITLAVAAPAHAGLAPHQLWTDIFGPNVDSDTYSDCAATLDGGYVAAGIVGDDGFGEATTADMVVTRFAADDAAADHSTWTRTWDNPDEHRADRAWAVTVDLEGNVIAAGYSKLAAGGQAMAIVKWNSSGVFQWKAVFAADVTGGSAGAYDVVCDGAGDVYVCGFSQTAATSPPAYSLVVRKLDGQTGTTLWTSPYAGPSGSFNQGNKLVLDDHANVYAVGYGTSSRGDSDIILVKFRAAGSWLWTKRIDTRKHLDDEGVDLAWRGTSIYVAGGRYTIISQQRGVAVARYTTAGTRLWLRTWQGTAKAVDYPKALAVDRYGNVAVAGGTREPTPGRSHAFLIKWDKSGTRRWAKVLVAPTSGQADYEDVVATAGGTFWVGGTIKSPALKWDWYVARYRPDGRRAWQSSWNGDDDLDEECRALCLGVGTSGLFGAGMCETMLGQSEATGAKYSR
jgi:hypothetical protein